MKTNFEIPEIISSLIILINFYIISVLPLSSLLYDYIYFIQIFLFIIYFVVKLDLNKVLNFRFEENNLVLYSEITLGLIFIIITLGISRDNNNDIRSISKIITYVLFFIVFFNFYSFFLISYNHFFNKFLYFIIVFSVINSIIGWYLIFFGTPSSIIYSGFHSGLFDHPNTNAYVYSLAIPIIYYKVVYAGEKNYLNLSILVFLFISMLFTYSRSALLGLGLALLIITFFKSKKYTVLFIIIISLLVFTILDYFLFVKGSSSSISRLLLFYTAYDMIADNINSFLFGYGVFRSLDIFVTEKLFSGSFEVVADPHNLMLLLAIQFGMIITISFLIFVLLVLIKSLVKINLLDSDIKGGVILSVSLIISLIVQSLFEDIVVYPEKFVYPVFLIFLGYLYHSNRFKINKPNI